MKKLAILIILVFLITSLSLMAGDAKPQSLNEIYKTGKVRFVEQLRIPGASFPEDHLMKSISGIVENEDKDIFLLDSGNHRIVKVDAKGKYLKTIGQKGQGPGDFHIPLYMTMNGDLIYIYELGNRRFSVLDNKGKFLKTIKNKDIQSLGLMRKMTWLSNGDILMDTMKNHRTGDNPQEIFLNLYSKDFAFKKTIYSRRFRYFTYFKKVMLLQPYIDKLSWSWGGDDIIAYGFSDKSQIHILNPITGEQKTINHEFMRIGISDQEKDAFFRRLNWEGIRVKGEIPELLLKNVHFPGYKPPFDNIAFDFEGNIIVFPLEKSPFFYAFDKNGKFIAKVDIISGEIFSHIFVSTANNNFWIYDQNKGMDEISVIKAKLISCK